MKNQKISSGLKGLDTILNGGYPAACPTLLKGGPGTGKTVFSLGFAHAQLQQGGSAVIATCDESPERLVGYMDKFGMQGSAHLASGKLLILDFRPNLDETVVGEYDLSPILLRISHAIEKSNAEILVIDSLQNLMMGLGVTEPRKEILELFDWVREKGVTTLVTTSAAQDDLQPSLLEEYAVDCVIHLSQHLNNQLMTRYLRVLKMRGSAHGSNSYPFSLNHSGVSLLPITATRLDHRMMTDRVSTGIPRIDNMLGGEGYYKGASLMISGRSGSGKTIFANTMVHQVLQQGVKAIYVTFEESESDMIRNLQSVGIDLTEYCDSGQLLIHSGRAIEMGLEDHLITIIDLVDKTSPELLVLDPVSALIDMGSSQMVKMLMIRFISYIRELGSSLLLTELLPDASDDYSELAISSLVDTWFRLRQVESNGELNRLINVVKSRGTKTSNQVKEFTIGEKGIVIEDPYIGEGNLVVGSAKMSRVKQDQEEADRKRFELNQIEQALSTLQTAYESKQRVLGAEFESEKQELMRRLDELKRQAGRVTGLQAAMQELREE
ncbi:MAG: circadian clock protein KaiC [Candidatus Thiodiazotropha lotti]|uniref:non-specific serine/threonine protein kinase n=1 Tax=Candidatus Thiodiazotropha lotti TaxID=2792787 RepID=A0A9E4K4S7_9GAMM|nr:circadian clock protein KaiC [Candidatus Thiodiazotropha lotti]MCG7939088.1 circadian clock protein KaiC [Candidatus Thiodiazotropha lotti]MCW4203562.1 circadian clock protein KaiC [Candidatus Thiodiazotropha lotti]MCW4222729.1 circadian clock protein KaiC [Candidatus Thiodiazotropha lotti]